MCLEIWAQENISMKLFSAIAVQLLAILLREGSKRVEEFHCPAIEFTCNCTSSEQPAHIAPSYFLIVITGVSGVLLGGLTVCLVKGISTRKNGDESRHVRRRGGGVLEDPPAW